MRHIIIHYHIFKNAGTTIDAILKQSFPETWTAFDTDTPSASIDPVTLERYIEASPSVVVLSSHQARLPIPSSATIKAYPLVFLRHPIDRVASIYHYLRRLPDSLPRPAIAFAKSHSMADFIIWRLQKEHGAVIRNFQTVFLSGDSRDVRQSESSSDHLIAAKSQLAALPFFGLVEAFDTSVQKMQDFLAPAFGKINTQYSPLNTNKLRSGTLDERLQQLRIELGESIYGQLLEAKSHDIALYTHAQSLFFSKL